MRTKGYHESQHELFFPIAPILKVLRVIYSKKWQQEGQELEMLENEPISRIMLPGPLLTGGDLGL